MTRLVFHAEDLVPVSQLCAEKKIPLSFARAQRYCRDPKQSKSALQPTLPAVLVARQWMTTHEAVSIWLRRGRNPAFDRLYA